MIEAAPNSIDHRPSGMTVSSKPRAAQESVGAFAFRAVLGIAVVAILLGHYDARPVFRALARERIGYFVAAIALYLASQVMSAWRWQLLARLNSITGPFREYLALLLRRRVHEPVRAGAGRRRCRARAVSRTASRSARRRDRVGGCRPRGRLARAVLVRRRMRADAAVSHLPAKYVHVTVTIGAAHSPVGSRRRCSRASRHIWAAASRCRHRAMSCLTCAGRSRSFRRSSCRLYSRHRWRFANICWRAGSACTLSLATFMLCVPIANVFASLPITLNGLGVREAAYLVLFGHGGLARSPTRSRSACYGSRAR